MALLTKQKPLLKKYWAFASDEIDLFKNGDAVSARRGRTNQHPDGAKTPVKDLIPKEGRRLARHLDGSRPTRETWPRLQMARLDLDAKVQAEQAIYFRRDAVT